jgi:hypothetical protein
MELHIILKIKEIYASQHIPTHLNSSQYIPIYVLGWIGIRDLGSNFTQVDLYVSV